MPKFVTTQDFAFFQHINKELVSEVVDVIVTLYKLNLDDVTVNIYGESLEKASYTSIELPALIDYPDNISISADGFGIDQTQVVDFRFVRKILEDCGVYPEIGDIIAYNSAFYEIDNIRETELVAGRPEYNQSILCTSHLTRRSGLQLEPRQL